MSFCSVIDLFSVIVLFCFVTVLRRVHIICHCLVLLSPTSLFCSVVFIVVLLCCRRCCHAVSSARSAIVPFLCNAVVVLFCCRHCCPDFVIVSCFVVVITLFSWLLSCFVVVPLLCHRPPVLSSSPCSVIVPLPCHRPSVLYLFSAIVTLLCHCLPCPALPPLPSTPLSAHHFNKDHNNLWQTPCPKRYPPSSYPVSSSNLSSSLSYSAQHGSFSVAIKFSDIQFVSRVNAFPTVGDTAKWRCIYTIHQGAQLSITSF